ncbi:hypothetical protein HY637_02790 [Candidatus Woesearchaeota archaeon]|nr:hypothetical protein [Candidatus Woesearchaeota archaeon]
MDKKYLRILAVLMVFILVLNLVLLATNQIKELFFWIVIAIAAFFGYVVIPKFKKSQN